jgi:hypothetical protein
MIPDGRRATMNKQRRTNLFGFFVARRNAAAALPGRKNL